MLWRRSPSFSVEVLQQVTSLTLLRQEVQIESTRQVLIPKSFLNVPKSSLSHFCSDLAVWSYMWRCLSSGQPLWGGATDGTPKLWCTGCWTIHWWPLPTQCLGLQSVHSPKMLELPRLVGPLLFMVKLLINCCIEIWGSIFSKPTHRLELLMISPVWVGVGDWKAHGVARKGRRTALLLLLWANQPVEGRFIDYIWY